jgi:hypothetical protein
MFGMGESSRDAQKRELTKEILYELYARGVLGAQTHRVLDTAIEHALERQKNGQTQA